MLTELPEFTPLRFALQGQNDRSVYKFLDTWLTGAFTRYNAPMTQRSLRSARAPVIAIA